MVEALVEEAVAVGVVVGYEPAGVLLGHEGQAGGLDELLKVGPGATVGRWTGGDHQGSLGLAQEADGATHQFGVGVDVLIGAVLAGVVDGDVLLVHFLLLDVHGDGEVYGPAPSAVGSAHGPGDELGDAPGILHHPRGLGDRGRHLHLGYLLHGSLAQLAELGGAGDGYHRALAVHGVGQAGDGVGEAGGGVHAYAGLAGDASPSVGHVDGGLLVACVDEAEVEVGHHVQHRQNVVAS